ncbi:MAG TPA: Hsp20/alpha crystallin family protein [Bryobacteraceae bacterium]|nr:Hsp20/alpha crystallin family protein [Bryobacteraceae bacterium]
MSTVATDHATAIREPSLPRPPRPADSVFNRIRRLWLGIRSIQAELLAFPVRTRRTNNNLMVLADLPGLKTEEVIVELNDSVILIEAEPNREGEPFFRKAGRRIIPLPDGAEIANAKALLKDGVLIVSLPVPHLKTKRRVSVEDGNDIDLRPT